MKTSIASSALRRGRRSLAGQIYLLTTSTANRRPWFAHCAIAAAAVEALADPATWPSANPLVWVLMPDHLHLLVEFHGGESLSRVMARIKGLIWRQLRPQLRVPDRLWQASFHDHALRRDENLLRVGRYLLENPVRAGLVDQPVQWRWRGGVMLGQIEAELPWS
jgi:REP element-mobilizing transposase RayT